MDAARALTLALVLVGGRSALAACALDASAVGPAALGPGPADFGQVPAACAGSDVALRLRGDLLVDSPDYYGAIAAGATLGGRLVLGPRWTASAAVDLLTWRYVVNAVVASSGAAIGPGTLGVARLVPLRGGGAAVFARLLAPFDGARRESRRGGVEAGGAFQLRPWGTLGVQGGLTLPGTLTVTGGVARAALDTALVAELVYAPRTWVALIGGTAVRVRAVPDPVFRAIAPRLAVRLVRSGWQLALGAELPALGTERTDASIGLFAGRAIPGLP